MKYYPALFTEEPEGGYTVTFRDVPEAITYGKTLEEARDMATDALSTAMEFYTDDDEPLPEPSKPLENEELVPLT